ncbi:MAG: DUF459 domain-containing protein, partial [Rhodospirillaceae bacterium]|nr:DUF459 domain-containing protein [Rhodospirillaceae bacterium]
LATEKAKVYWIGLPPVRSAVMSRDYRMLNAIYRAQAAKHGFIYVDIGPAFSDAKGGYTSFGRSVDGVKRRLRKRDGKHFSLAGERLLAEVVARALAGNMSATKTAP